VGRDEPLRCDAVVLAVGATAATRLVTASPALQPLQPMSQFGQLRGITCVAVRMYLRPAARATTGLEGGAHDSTLLPRDVALAMKRSPVVVVGPAVGGLRELRETGFCIYDLQRMHDEHAAGTLAVLEVDFFRADAIADMDDDNSVADLALRAAAAALDVPPSVLDRSMVVDVAVVRARRAVSHFDVGSAAISPGVKLGDGVYACGDWIDRTGHASWSTEKAVVTGKQAAGALAEEFGLGAVDATVIPAAADTPALAALRQVASTLRSASARGAEADLPPPSPWAQIRSLLQP
jgi:hypothetical protein